MVVDLAASISSQTNCFKFQLSNAIESYGIEWIKYLSAYYILFANYKDIKKKTLLGPVY
jgi:hypothetical protein